VERLRAAVADLVTFFERVRLPGRGSGFWATRLTQINDELAEPASRAIALEKLDQCFGGMGTLNDYVFDSRNNNIPTNESAELLNRQLDQLLDRVYQEHRLVGQPFWVRIYWWWLARRHQGAPPRVLNAFPQKRGKD
jgi:hypothetical protein